MGRRKQSLDVGITIAQHNNLVNAKYYMDVMEMKTFIYLLSKIKKTDKQFKLIKIPLKYFIPKDLKKVGGGYYENVKAMSQRIVGRTVAVENVNEDNKRKLAAFNLVSRCDYVEGNDFLVASLNTQAKDWLLELKGNFTQSSVKELLKLNSYYSMRMYNWLMQTSNFSSGRIMKIEDIKYMITDPKDLKTIYQDFRDFEKRILKKAQDELENTDMAFTYRKIKEGKSVAKIHFKLKRHQQQQEEDTTQLGLFEDEKKAIPMPVLTKLQRNVKLIGKRVDPEDVLTVRCELDKLQAQKILEATGDHKNDFYDVFIELRNYLLEYEQKREIKNYPGLIWAWFKKKYPKL